MVQISRRTLLALTAGGAVGLRGAGRGRVWPTLADAQSDEGFDPARHGFGFPNWEGDTGTTADGSTFTYEPANVSLEQIRHSVQESWSSALSEAQTAITTRIVYSWIGGNAATDGHCYGMVFSADQYYNHPDSLPAGADVASDVDRPTGRYTEVGDRIRELQSEQLLRAEPWWFAFFGLRWGLADHLESLALAVDAVDDTGTAGLSLDGPDGPHQVLAYDYRREDDRTQLFVYDPNFAAEDYHDTDTQPVLTVDRETGALVDVEGYDEFLYHHPEMDRSAVDRVLESRDAVLSMLSNAVFLSLDVPGRIEVEAPEGAVVDRPTAPNASPGPYGDAVVIVGADVSEIDVRVVGERSVEYTLRALGVRDGEVVLQDELTDSLGESATRFSVVADEAGNATLQAASDATSEASRVEDRWWVLAGAGGALGAGAAYRYFSRRGDEDDA